MELKMTELEARLVLLRLEAEGHFKTAEALRYVLNLIEQSPGSHQQNELSIQTVASGH
jgi:hypothetical protein